MFQFISRRKVWRHWPALLVALTFLGLASLYSIVTPLFEAPDELWHYPVVWHIARTGELPVQDPTQVQLWEHEGSQAPLYYLLAALLTAIIPAGDLSLLLYRNPHADIGLVTPDGNANIIVHTAREAWPWNGAVLAVRLTRLFSASLATGTVLTVYALGRLLWPARPAFALLAMTFVAFNPMFIFIAGSVNNDNLITLLASLTLWQLAALLVRETAPPLPLWRWVWVGVLTGLTALAKLSGLGMVGLVGITLLWRGWQQGSWRIALLGNGVVIGVAVLVAGWWYWRNFALYGDWSGTQPILDLMAPRPFPPGPAHWAVEAAGLMRSFWGVFGYLSILMPASVHRLFNALFVIGMVGSVLALLPDRVGKLPPHLRRLWPVLALWLLLIFGALIWYTRLIPSSQGRLLFPAIAAIALLWATGWSTLLSPQVQMRWRQLWLWAPVLFMLLVALWAPWGVIAPAYRQPAPIATLPATAQPLAVTFGDVATLLGYESKQTTIRPGDRLSITLYWQGETPTTIDYSLFIHLVDEAQLLVAQRDLFHGPGVYPTSQWASGTRFADTYVLQLPTTAFAPTSAHFVVGLYNRLTGERLLAATGGDRISFGRIQIEPRPGAFPNSQMLRFDDGITLMGYSLDRRVVEQGDTITLTLYWQAHRKPEHRYKVFVHLIDDNTHKAAQRDSEPQAGAVPTDTWQPGQIVRDQHPLAIALDAPPGFYQITVGLYARDTGERLPLLADQQTLVQTDSIPLSRIQVK